MPGSARFNRPTTWRSPRTAGKSVPVPHWGYWNKLQAGKRAVKVGLPERDLVTLNRIEMSGTLPPELRQRIKGEPGKDIEEAHGCAGPTPVSTRSTEDLAE